MYNYKNTDELIEAVKKSHKENKSFKFKIKVVANSSLDLIDFQDEFIKIKIKARAIEGRANKAIIEFLAKKLGYPKSKVLILNGEKSAIKTIEIKL